MTTTIGLLGSTGRMGQIVATLIREEYSKTASLLKCAALKDPLEPLLEADVVIDFSLPQAMSALAIMALRAKGARLPVFVIGSTGWTPEQRKSLNELAEKTPVVVSSNFSTGILALNEILKQAAPLLEKLGYKPIMTDIHHQYKKDAPSGTALTLKQTLVDSSGFNEIPINCVRAGGVIGEHEVAFYSKGDRLEFSHRAEDRSIFARGAIDVALWLVARYRSNSSLKGFIDMKEFLVTS